MKLIKKVEDALNAQLGMEYGASLKYDSIASYFSTEDLPQLSKFFFKQANEEREHAHKILKYLLDRDGSVKIPAIPATPHSFGSPREAVKVAQDSELAVSKAICELYEIALEERDHATAIMLQWFITEQVEEEATIKQLSRFVERGDEFGMMTVEDYLAEAGAGEHSASSE